MPPPCFYFLLLQPASQPAFGATPAPAFGASPAPGELGTCLAANIPAAGSLPAIGRHAATLHPAPASAAFGAPSSSPGFGAAQPFGAAKPAFGQSGLQWQQPLRSSMSCWAEHSELCRHGMAKLPRHLQTALACVAACPCRRLWRHHDCSQPFRSQPASVWGGVGAR